MRLLVLAAIAVVAAGSGFAIVAATNSSAERTASTPKHGSYCDAVSTALEYDGHESARRSALLDRVVALAPAEVEPIVRDVRAAAPGSARAAAARNLWTYYNDNHCCDCYDGRRAPQIAALTPEQRARVEAGGQP